MYFEYLDHTKGSGLIDATPPQEWRKFSVGGVNIHLPGDKWLKTGVRITTGEWDQIRSMIKENAPNGYRVLSVQVRWCDTKQTQGLNAVTFNRAFAIDSAARPIVWVAPRDAVAFLRWIDT